MPQTVLTRAESPKLEIDRQTAALERVISELQTIPWRWTIYLVCKIIVQVRFNYVRLGYKLEKKTTTKKTINI